MDLDLTRFDRVSGELMVIAKGNREHIARLSPTALRTVKEYLRRRPTASTSTRLWLTEGGRPLTYWAGQSIIRRLRERSGINRLHAHLFRHTFAQVALQKGAERALLQDMLNHRTDMMSRRYAGTMRQETAARAMPKFSPI